MTDIAANDEHVRPDGLDERTIEAVGKTTEALEWVERARGRLYDFHQLIGRADLLFDEAASLLDKAGHSNQAEELRQKVVGLNLLQGRWSFQIVEEFDDGYYTAVKASEKAIRDQLAEGRRHVYESEMKEHRRSDGLPGHEARP